MSEINREAAIRWIKAECNPYGKPTLDYETSCRIMEHLDRMPSAESEIIRCKDCKHIQKWRSEESAKKFGQIYECARSVFYCPKPEDFCSYAERRTDETD